jgi:tetratricopeptide (TPR) repeat protein
MKKYPFVQVLRYLAFIAIIFIPVVINAQSRRDRDEARRLQAEADKSFLARNYREAADKYGQAVELVPTNPYAHYQKGFAHYNLKENLEAIRSLTAALTQGHKPLDVYRLRHYAYSAERDYRAALADVDSGLKLAPNDPDLMAARGEILLEQRSYPEAMAVFQSIVKANPDSADTFYRMARVHFATGDLAGQAETAQSALSKGTLFPGEAFFLLGDAHKKLKNNSRAIDAFQKSLNVKPDRHETYKHLADIYVDENRLTEAINVYKKGLLTFPGDGGFYTELSWLYSLAGRAQDAVDAAKAGIIYRPNEAAAHTNLCRAYNEVKKPEFAVGACNAALKIKPGDGETHFYLGRALDLAGKPAEATRNYRLAVQGLESYVSQAPDSSDAWYLLGNAYFADNQREKAIDSYQKAIGLRPKFSRAYYNLGIIYALKKDKTAASTQYRQLLSLDNKLADALKSEIDKI